MVYMLSPLAITCMILSLTRLQGELQGGMVHHIKI